jgi:phosphate transport system permease protein
MALALSRSLKDRLSGGWMAAAVIFILLLPLSVLLGLVIKSIPVLQEIPLVKLLFSSEWLPMKGIFGFYPFIISSIIVSVVGLLILIPMTLFPAIYLTQFAPNELRTVMRSVIDVLAGIPSVIHGLWGVLVVVPMVSEYIAPVFGAETAGYTILSAAIVVAVSVIPFVLNMLLEVFRVIPVELKEVTLSLGATYWETIRKVILRKAFPGILSAYTLGLSKAFGETIAVLMVVGNVVQIPGSLLDAGYPLPALMANNYGEMLSIPMYDSALMFSALLLFAVVFVFNLIARIVISKTERV